MFICCFHTEETRGGRRIVVEDSNPVDDSTPGKLKKRSVSQVQNAMILIKGYDSLYIHVHKSLVIN